MYLIYYNRQYLFIGDYIRFCIEFDHCEFVVRKQMSCLFAIVSLQKMDYNYIMKQKYAPGGI